MNADELRHEIEQLDVSQGISLLKVLEVSEPLAKLFRKMIRMRKLTVADIAAVFDIQEEEAAQLTNLMAEKGFLRTAPQRDGSIAYRVRFHETGERGLSSSIWDSFE